MCLKGRLNSGLETISHFRLCKNASWKARSPSLAEKENSDLLCDLPADWKCILIFKEKKRMFVYCVLGLSYFCLVNNFYMIFKGKKESWWRQDFEPGAFGLQNWHLTADPLMTPSFRMVIKHVYISNMASRTIRPPTFAVPQFQF